MGTWVGGEENSIHFTRNADGSRIALPIAGKFLTKVYKDGSLGVERTDRFKRSDEEPDYSCSENMEGTINEEDEESTFIIDDHDFF
jgi:penicillin-binding protein 1A